MNLISSTGVSQLRHVAQLVERLAGDEFALRLVALGGKTTPTVSSNGAGNSRFAIGLRNGFDPRAFRDLRRTIAEFAPDVLHACDHRAARYAAAALWGARQARLVIGPMLPSDREQGGRPWLNRLVERRASRVVTTSTHATRGGEQTAVIPYGVTSATRDVAFRRALLKEFQLPEESRLLGVAGPLQPRQRIKDAIWAADLLKCVRDDTHLLILGEGPHRWRLERYCRQVQVSDRVHFLGERAEQREILATLDCYWATACEDEPAWPTLEAMAAGVPVVAVDASATRALFSDSESAPLVGAGDRASRARHTQAMLNDAELARARGAAGQRAVLERFSLEQMDDAYRALYRDLADFTKD